MHRPILVALALALVLLACFEVPLGKPEDARIDPRLDGLWIDQENPGGDYAAWLVVPFDEHAYCLLCAEFDSEGKEKAQKVGALRGWITMVSGSPFISLEPVQQLLPEYGKDKDYMLARLSFETDGRLGVELVNYQFGELQHTKTTEALTRMVEENIRDPKLLEKQQRFRRIDATVGAERAIRTYFMGK